MFKNLPPNLIAAVAAINQTSRAAFVVEQDALRKKKLMQPSMPKQPAPKADPAAHPGAKKMAEGVEGSIPKTPKEKELAAKHGHPKRITFGDVLKARGVTRQEATLHPNQQKLDVHEPEKDELTAKDFKMLRANKKPKKVDQINELKTPTLLRYQTKANKALIGGDRNKEEKRIKGIQTANYKIQSRHKVKEEVEHLDELKKDTLKSYVSKATDSARTMSGYGTNVEKSKKTIRHAGISKATEKLAKEEVDQIDELSKSTLGSYVKKASRDAVVTRKIGADFANQANKSRKPSMKSASTALADKWKSKSWNRSANINKAVDRLTKEEVEQTQEGWNDMMQASRERAEKEKTDKGTGKFNKQVVSTGTVYTRKASTFDDGGGKDADERKVDRMRRSASKQEAVTAPLPFKHFVEATGPNHLHVSDAGNNKYKVHSVGSNFSNGIKVGEHLTDTHLDDFADMGGKITHVKPTAPKAQPK